MKMTTKVSHPITLILALLVNTVCVVIPVFHLTASASQLPENENIPLPEPLPGPQDILGTLPILEPSTLDGATQMVWDAILEKERADLTVARILSGVPVILSGVMRIDGEIQLYLGIERSYYEKHGGERLHQALSRRFPNLPIHVEASDGIIYHSQKETILLSETFDTLDAWTAQGFFAPSSGWTAQPLAGSDGNAAQTHSCPWVCNLTLTESLDLSAYDEVTLSFDRFVDENIGANEYVAVLVGNNGEYTRLAAWTEGDSAWQTETYTLTDLSDAVNIRFIARTNIHGNHAIDNVVIRTNGASDEPAEEVNEHLTITTDTSVPLSARSGSAVTLQAMVTNTGTETAAPATIKVYRHAEQTTTPRTGGIEEGSTATGTIAAGTAESVTMTVTVPAVSTGQTYYYYLCTSNTCADSIAVQVRPSQVPTNTPDFSIPTITAAQTHATVTIQTTVTNSGTASGNTRPITVYRHTAVTTTPTTGTLVGSVNTGTVPAGTSVTKTVTEEVPGITTPTTYYYYACVEATFREQITDNNCATTPATITVQPAPTTYPDLTVTNVSTTPTTPQEGTAITIRATIANIGTASVSAKTVRMYRHRTRTTNPRTGGVEVGTASIGILAAGASVSRTATHTVPAVTAATTYYLYACADTDAQEQDTDNNCAKTPATITVQPAPETEPEPEQEPGTRPDLTVTNISVTPSSVRPGSTITISATVTNIGEGSAPSKDVRVYRHTKEITNPRIGGIRLREKAVTGALAPGATRTASFTSQARQTTRTYYYYACVATASNEQNAGNNCVQTPATVLVTERLDELAPVPIPPHEWGFPYNTDIYADGGGVITMPERTTPMGGDLMLVHWYDHRTKRLGVSWGTVTLGGLETISGKRGFVVSAHVVARYDTFEGYSDISGYIGHTEYAAGHKLKRLLGKMMRMPPIRKEGSRFVMDPDAAFVAYPSPPTAGCSLVWESADETYCLDLNLTEQIATMSPLVVRGRDRAIYTVVGSKTPTIGLKVRTFGSFGGSTPDGEVVGGRLLFIVPGDDVSNYVYPINKEAEAAVAGDSGGPVYTLPDKDGNVHIVGVHVGTLGRGGDVFSSWDDVTEGLGLKPIQ